MGLQFCAISDGVNNEARGSGESSVMMHVKDFNENESNRAQHESIRLNLESMKTGSQLFRYLKNS